MKNLRFCWLFFQNENCWHFEILMNQMFGQRFIIFEKLKYRDKILLSYVPPKLLLHFIEYCPHQLNNKHVNIAVNLTMQLSESYYQKQYLVKARNFSSHSLQNDGHLKFLQNGTETIF